MSGEFYQRLRVEPTATTGQIKSAYSQAVAELVRRRKALAEQGDDASELEGARGHLDEAWEVLSDPVRRRRYDAMLAWRSGAGEGGDFWARVQPSLVHPAAAAAIRLLRRTTHLSELGEVRQSPSAAEGEPPTLVPADEDRTAPVAFTLGTQPVSDPGAPVVPLPTASPSPPGSSLRVVDGSPGASSVIVLPSDAPRAKTLAAEDIALLVDQHGFSGALLRSVREARDLSLQDVADQTRISVRYLQGIEDEDFGSLPSPTFVQGYVREMVRMLRIDSSGVVDGYMRRFSGE